MPMLIDLAALQDRVLGVLISGTERRVKFASRDSNRTLASAIDDAVKREIRLPEGIVLRFDHIRELFPTARGVLDGWKEGADDLVRLFAARSQADFERTWADLWNREDWKRALDAVAQFGSHQALLGVSFITTLKYFTQPNDLPDRITHAYERYFFDSQGFSTVDGISIRRPSPPDLSIGNSPGRKALGEFLGEQTGERYLRDLIRIAVEVAGDAQFKLSSRMKQIETTPGLNAAARDLARQWLTGFASMAEGLVMSSVEQMAQGVSSFTANPLVAAAASTIAAVAARKATQHAFLWEMNIALA